MGGYDVGAKTEQNRREAEKRRLVEEKERTHIRR